MIIKKETLEYYLFNTYLSINEIAKELNTSRWYVEKYMNIYNIQRTPEYNYMVKSLIEKEKKSKRTSEQIKDWLDKVKQTKLKRYGDENYNNMSKNMETKLERYGDKHYNNSTKQRQTCIRHFGYENITQKRVSLGIYESPFNNIDIINKAKQTKLVRYGNENYNNPIKQLNSYKKYHGRWVSKPEINLRCELEKYYNVETQVYINNICCDFRLNHKYYIELHGVFYHNYRPFNNTSDDIAQYNKLKISGPLKAKIADVWRYKDVYELNYFKDNNIPYIAIYYGNKNLQVIDENNIYAKNIQEIIEYLKTIISPTTIESRIDNNIKE